MSVDFVVIFSVRQRFGDAEQDPFSELNSEPNAPFVGASKSFPFQTPGVDTSESAILQFQSMGVGHRDNVLRVNGTDVFGGLSRSNDLVILNAVTGAFPVWSTHSLLLHPGILRSENTLFIESRPPESAPEEHRNNLDNFIIDNVFVTYKTSPLQSGGGTTGEVIPR